MRNIILALSLIVFGFHNWVYELQAEDLTQVSDSQR